MTKIERHSVDRIYLRQSCSHGSRWIKPFKTTRRCSDLYVYQYLYVGLSWRNIFRVAAHTMSEKAIRFRHPDYNPHRAQKLISSSMSRHLSTRNNSSKSMHAFLCNLAHRQTDKRTRAKTYTSSFVRGKKIEEQTATAAAVQRRLCHRLYARKATDLARDGRDGRLYR